jgi:GNAT superfamily N-acetyltransferase
MDIRSMGLEELDRISEVNRAELVEASYQAAASPDGRGLVLQKVANSPPVRIAPWGASDLERRLSQWRPAVADAGLMMGALSEGRLVAFAVLGRARDDGSAELLALFVDSERRRRGIGSLLLEVVETRARQQGIAAIFAASNCTASAVEFYLRQGYHVITLTSNLLVRRGTADPVFAKRL